jgi:hypothetical protein
MIFFGRRATKLEVLNINGTICPHCGSLDTQHLTVFGKYAHIYWIPFFPLSKVPVAECSHCLKTVSRKDFSEELKQFYERRKGSVKRPIWHWAGMAIVAAFIAFIFLIKVTTKYDQRREMLRTDINLMSSEVTQEKDSLAYLMKTFFDDFITVEGGSDEFKYFTRVKDDKLLILVRIPNLKTASKEERETILKTIESIADLMDSVKDKKRYIGVHGRFNLMMLKTPTVFENENIIADNALYEFYGPEVIPKE